MNAGDASTSAGQNKFQWRGMTQSTVHTTTDVSAVGNAERALLLETELRERL